MWLRLTGYRVTGHRTTQDNSGRELSERQCHHSGDTFCLWLSPGLPDFLLTRPSNTSLGCPTSTWRLGSRRYGGSASQRGSHQVHRTATVPLGDVSFNLRDREQSGQGADRQAQGLRLWKLGCPPPGRGRLLACLSPASAALCSSPAAGPAWVPERPAPEAPPAASPPSALSSKPTAVTASASAEGTPSLGPHTCAGHPVRLPGPGEAWETNT